MHIREVQGAQAVRNLMEELIQPSVDEVLGVSDLDALQRAFPEFKYAESNDSRLKAGVPSRFLYTSLSGPIYAVNDTANNRESRYVPYLPFGDITMVGDKLIVVHMDGEPWAAVFQSKSLVKAYTQLFEFFWEKSRSYNQ